MTRSTFIAEDAGGPERLSIQFAVGPLGHAANGVATVATRMLIAWSAAVGHNPRSSPWSGSEDAVRTGIWQYLVSSGVGFPDRWVLSPVRHSTGTIITHA
jgi:hypothetical protein